MATDTALSWPNIQGKEEEWVRNQLVKHSAKREERERRHTQDPPVVVFDRQEFSHHVQDILDGDVSDGFVIGLKRRREFAAQLCEDYKHFTEAQKLELVMALAVDLGIHDLSRTVKTLPSIKRSGLVLDVMAASLGFSRKNDLHISKSIKRGLVPLAEQLFLLVGSIPSGPKFLLRLRVDLEIFLKKYAIQLSKDDIEALEFLDVVMRDLFATQGSMRFRRIDMSSEKLVSFVLLHERVHPIRNWADLQRRIAGPNRFCFGLFHLNMPNSPLVFVEVLVTDHLLNCITPVLEKDSPVMEEPSHIIFYSISNANGGLKGLNAASHLLFLTIQRMGELFPQCHTSATLSPVPGFASWFKAALNDQQQRSFFTPEQTQRITMKFGVNRLVLNKWLQRRLNEPKWHEDADFVEIIRDVMLAACARYVLFARKGKNKILDPVANFHLQNGAQVEQINFLADVSPQAMRSSFGMMINYRYSMTVIDITSVSYKRNTSVAISPAVARLVCSSRSPILDELERLHGKRDIPLFARVYQPKEAICSRGSLPTGIYFMSSGRVRVQSAHPYSLEEGHTFGERPVLNEEPVAFTVRAETLTHLLVLPCNDARGLQKESQALKQYLPQFIQASRL